MEGLEGSGATGGVRSPSWRAGSGKEALSEGWVGFGRSSCKARRGREALPESWEGWEGREKSGGPSVGPGRVGRLSWRAVRGLGGPHGGPGGVRRPFQRAGRVWEGRKRLRVSPVGLEGSGGSPGGLGEIWMGREALPVG